MKRWWAGRATRHRATMALGIIAVLAMIGAAVGCASPDDSADKPTTSAEATVAPVLIAPAEKPAPPADTGRMSEREWTLAKSAVLGVNGKVRDYTEKLASRCAVLLQAGAVAEALTCFDEAYAGVEDRVIVSVYQLDTLKADVGKGCAKVLGYAYNVLNEDLFRALRESREALDSMDSLVIAPSPALRLQRNRWDHASGAMLQLCAPA
jgi:hypothetical protein